MFCGAKVCFCRKQNLEKEIALSPSVANSNAAYSHITEGTLRIFKQGQSDHIAASKASFSFKMYFFIQNNRLAKGNHKKVPPLVVPPLRGRGGGKRPKNTSRN